MRSPARQGAFAIALACGALLAQAFAGTPVAGPASAMGAARASTAFAAADPAPGKSAPVSIDTSASAVIATQAQIRAATAKLRADPNLGTDHKIRSLHWISRDTPPPPDSRKWILEWFDYLGQGASLLLWLVGTVAAAAAAIWIYRLIRAHSPEREPKLAQAASHIGGLDIRPASLPDDVAGAAHALLRAGRTRDALSLLYRGALSRAVHHFDVTIQESFTEGEALRAVESRLDLPRADYFRELVGLWQRAVYAGQTAATEQVAALCSRFAPTLEHAP